MASSLLLKLQQRDHLSAEEKAVVKDLCNASRTFAPGEPLVREGDRPGHSSIVESGWAGRVKFVGEGAARTISALHLAGDFIDLHSFLLKPMDHAVIALTECRMSLVPHDRLRIATEKYPHLARLFWLDTLVDAAIHRSWIACLGRRSAAQRLAHLFCELLIRCQVVGRVEELSYDLPLTQTVLADTLGITTTHLNRSLQELRAKELIRFGSGRLRILNWDRLRELADFDPAYLNMTCEPR